MVISLVTVLALSFTSESRATTPPAQCPMMVISV